MHDLADRWEDIAAHMEAFGCSGAALRRCAAELREELRKQEHGLLSPTEAEAVSGYTARRLRQLVQDGQLRNYGAKHRPRYKRCELPRKANTKNTAIR